jgi:hypothetical protein
LLCVANINIDDQKNAHINQNYDGDCRDLICHLNEKCGTNRAVGGGLNDQVCNSEPYPKYVLWVNCVLSVEVGRHILHFSSSARDSLYSEALEIVATAGSAAKTLCSCREACQRFSMVHWKESKRYALMACHRHLR